MNLAPLPQANKWELEIPNLNLSNIIWIISNINHCVQYLYKRVDNYSRSYPGVVVVFPSVSYFSCCRYHYLNVMCLFFI